MINFFSKFDENYKSKDPRSNVKLKQEKPYQTITFS